MAVTDTFLGGIGDGRDCPHDFHSVRSDVLADLEQCGVEGHALPLGRAMDDHPYREVGGSRAQVILSALCIQQAAKRLEVVKGGACGQKLFQFPDKLGNCDAVLSQDSEELDGRGNAGLHTLRKCAEALEDI